MEICFPTNTSKSCVMAQNDLNNTGGTDGAAPGPALNTDGQQVGVSLPGEPVCAVPGTGSTLSPAWWHRAASLGNRERTECFVSKHWQQVEIPPAAEEAGECREPQTVQLVQDGNCGVQHPERGGRGGSCAVAGLRSPVGRCHLPRLNPRQGCGDFLRLIPADKVFLHSEGVGGCPWGERGRREEGEISLS